MGRYVPMRTSVRRTNRQPLSVLQKNKNKLGAARCHLENLFRKAATVYAGTCDELRQRSTIRKYLGRYLACIMSGVASRYSES